MEHPTLQQLFTAFAPTSLAYRSDAVTPGAVFFCIKGAKSDGHDFAPDAAARGAIALVVEHPVPVDLPQTVVSNARTALALASVRFFGDPSAHLAVTAVTGTNGKTTTTYLVDWIIRHALQAQGQPAGTTGLIGTVETRIKASRLPSKYTTPESYDLQELLRHMADEGVTHVTMEASSHALALDRVAGMHVCVAAFSNLTQDHLDFHGTMEAYFEAKAKLFDSPLVAARVVNIDDAYGRTLAQRCESNGHAAYTVGFSPGAQLQATAVTYTSEGSQLTVRTEQGAFTFAYPLIGAFNAHNVLLAAGCAHLLGIDYPTITAALAQAPQVPGRLERVKLEGQQGGQVAQGAGAVLARLRDPKAARTHSAQQSPLRSVQIAHPSDPSQPSRSESPATSPPPAPL
ncbi:MAG: UDP-N-acetylmuramoyl-L-alanyl-D-glutamate--2,6-diaminopimelate ligase, partial [Coriobacteriales bacterium]|nr:UDP-N-acetylmuramoyl-L-alanyl-D-glutamate--2,6-diaminopimelate ligase [Coriobacteriales bacterium]